MNHQKAAKNLMGMLAIVVAGHAQQYAKPSRFFPELNEEITIKLPTKDQYSFKHLGPKAEKVLADSSKLVVKFTESGLHHIYMIKERAISAAELYATLEKTGAALNQDKKSILLNSTITHQEVYKLSFVIGNEVTEDTLSLENNLDILSNNLLLPEQNFGIQTTDSTMGSGLMLTHTALTSEGKKMDGFHTKPDGRAKFRIERGLHIMQAAKLEETEPGKYTLRSMTYSFGKR